MLLPQSWLAVGDLQRVGLKPAGSSSISSLPNVFPTWRTLLVAFSVWRVVTFWCTPENTRVSPLLVAFFPTAPCAFRVPQGKEAGACGVPVNLQPVRISFVTWYIQLGTL